MDVDLVADEGLRLTSEQWKAVGSLAGFTERLVVVALSGHKTPTRALNVVKEVHIPVVYLSIRKYYSV